ncbi:MAG: DUF6261 family protein [Salinivirgaceae bacterium]
MSFLINLSKLTHNLIVSLGEELAKAVEGIEGIQAVLTPFQSLLVRAKEALNNVIEKTRAREVSQQLKNTDNQRDGYLYGLDLLVEAHLYHPDEALRNAAGELKRVLDKLEKSTYRLPYDAESAVVKTLLTDLTGDYAPQANSIHATPFVTALSEVQTGFDNFRSQQINENASIAVIESMTAIRREFELSMRSLLSVLAMLIELNPDDEALKSKGIVVQEVLKKYR